jgi:hypothetical protein
VNGSDKPFKDIVSMIETMLDDPDAPIANPVPLAAILTAAELRVRLAESELGLAAGAHIPDSRLAAYFDGGLDDDERREVGAFLARSPVSLHEAAATLAYLDNVGAQYSSVPENLLEAAIGALTKHRATAAPQADIVPLRRAPARQQHSDPAALAESFHLLAAASDTGSQAIVCCSQSGIWTLEVFDGRSERSHASRRGYLLLAVHPDHAATYEGRTARVFVKLNGEERVLAEETVRNGEVYAEISLTGLDLRTKDAVNVVFGPAP